MLAKKEVIIPGFWNSLFMLFDKLLPKWFKEMLIEKSMKQARTFKNPITHIILPLKTAV
jgi:hypothetical protein